MIQQEDPIDIINAKIQNDIININELYCFTQGHQAEIAVALTQEKKLMCQSCADIYKNQTGQKTIQIQLMVENLNQKFRDISQKFLQIQNFYQSELLNELINHEIDQKIRRLNNLYNKTIQNIEIEKNQLLLHFGGYNFQDYEKFKSFIQQTLQNSQDIKKLDEIISNSNLKYMNQLNENLIQNMNKIKGQIMVDCHKIIVENFQIFNKESDQLNKDYYLQIIKIQKDKEQQQIQKSVIDSTPNPNNNQKILRFQLLNARENLKKLMNDHLIQSRSNNGHFQIKLEGGGSFGYSFTGGYGLAATLFENLPICLECQDCVKLNGDMNQICVKLYYLEYRDGIKWWVEAWFLLRDV